MRFFSEGSLRNYQIVLFSIVIVFKISLTVFTINQQYESDVPESFALCTGDCPSYLEPIENLVKHHSYTPDFRMPGYGVFYLPLYYFFSKPVAMNLLIVLQTLMDILAAFLFIKLAILYTGKKTAGISALIFYGIGCTISVYNKSIQTESITASLFVYSIYFIVIYHQSKNKIHLLLSSLFMTWSYFCRPVFFPLFILLSLFMVYNHYKNFRTVNLVFFLLPFLLIQGAWTLRNYFHHQKVFLLTKTAYLPLYQSSELAAYSFQGTIGDFRDNYFFPDSNWKNRSTPRYDIDTVEFPSEIYTKDFNRDSLIELRRYAKILRSTSDTITALQKIQYNDLFTIKAERYTSSIKRNHPFLTYIKAPAIRVYKHLFKSSGVQYLFMKGFNSLTLIEKTLKMFFIFIFLSALYGSLFFIISIIINYKNPLNILFCLFCLYGMLIHPTILGTANPRYLYAFYPILALCATLFYTNISFLKISEKFK